MAIYGAFAAPILGMLSQSAAFGTISQNISNMNTGGYKATNTRFSTILASHFDANSDVGGIRAIRKTYVNQQGRTISTNNSLDLAINGKGMFLLNTEIDGSGEELYTRDGGFQVKLEGTSAYTLPDGTTTQIGNGYLADKNGHFVMAWQPDATGNFSTASAVSGVRIDEAAFTSEAVATENASLAVNIPVTDSGLATRYFVASVHDSTGELRSIKFVFTKDESAPLRWALAVETGDAADTISSGGAPSRAEFLPTIPSSVTSQGAGGLNYVGAYPAAQILDFDDTGHLPEDATFDFSVAWSDGEVSTVSVDLSNVTNTGQLVDYIDFQKDGRAPGALQSFYFDDAGQVLGKFTNGVERALYKLPLATFVNPDGLEARQGNVFAETPQSGSTVLRQVKDPAVVSTGTINNQAKNEFGVFVPFTHELGNTSLEAEFTLMIMAQQAYNSSATVFKTLDEMAKTAAQLKSG